MAGEDRLERFRQSLLDCPVIKRGEYDYFIHPLVDGIPFIEHDLLDEVTDEIIEIANPGYERIVTVEAMGIPLGSVVSLKTSIPLNIIRKRPYFMEDEHVIDQATGYSKGKLYINGLKPGMKVLVVDDVLSTGGTVRAVIKGLLEVGVDILDVVILVEKSDIKEELEEELDIKIKTMSKIDIVDDKVVLIR
jgi:adenine phosphoribosyltransferase